MIKVKVSRRRWDTAMFYFGDDFATYKGEGAMAPTLHEYDADGRIYPGHEYALFVPEKGKDSEGDQKGKRYHIYGARLRLYAYIIVEGWVMGDGTKQYEHTELHKALEGSEQFHLERWDFQIS